MWTSFLGSMSYVDVAHLDRAQDVQTRLRLDVGYGWSQVDTGLGWHAGFASWPSPGYWR